MTKPENRWQLLLVADDGRIVPFRRVRGIFIAVVVLLAALALACALLGWQLTAERVRHRRSLSQLADAKQQAARYKRQHELATAELVLAEARMEKAGLPIPQRPVRVPELPSSVDAAESDAAEAIETAQAPPAKLAPVSTPPGAAEPTDEAAAGLDRSAAQPAPVELEDFSVAHDTQKGVLTARLRIQNVDADGSPVAGRCVVVLETEPDDADKRVALPHGVLPNGSPDGSQGQAFKISHFIDLDLMAPAPREALVFKTAVAYVFDENGKELLRKKFPIAVTVNPPAPPAKAAQTPAAETRDSASPAPRASVAVDELAVAYAAGAGRLDVRFRLKNVGPPTAPVAGRCVVVFHGEGTEPAPWLAAPDVPLEAGRPDGSKGRSFRIARFIDMEMHVDAPPDPSVFSQAVVYVFDSDGHTLLDKTFPVDIPAPPASSTAPAPQAPDQSPAASTAPPESVPPETAPPVDSAGEPAAETPSPESAVPVPTQDSRSRF